MLGLAAALALVTASPQALEILERHQCHRCHQVEGLAELPSQKGCAGCHQEIASAADDEERMAKGRAQYGAVWDRFVERTATGYCYLPPLSGMGRVRARWLAGYLASPYDLRPNMTESMLRHNLSAAEISALVKGWGARPEPLPSRRPSRARLMRGAELYDEKGCATCHLFGNRPSTVAEGFQFDLMPTVRYRAMAPDLRHARDRLGRDTVLAVLRDPTKVMPAAAMPKPEATDEEISVLADFVLFGDPGPAARAVRVRPPPYRPRLGTPTYEEVEAQVFKRVCWHCHSNPDFANDDGGPGNTGGFGFAPLGLSFASFEEVMNGSEGPDGERRSIFRKGVTGETVLMERLRARYVENDRDFVRPGQDDLRSHQSGPSKAPRGMPLGLPALSAEQFSLVERWVRGGRPGPASGTQVSGASPVGR